MKKLFCLLLTAALFLTCFGASGEEISVVYIAQNGAEMIITPISAEEFWAQEETVKVNTLIGRTNLPEGTGLPSTVMLPGSRMPLSMMQLTLNASSPLIAFSFETTDPDSALSVIDELGQKTFLKLGEERFPVTLAWTTETYACFFFDVDFPADGIPVFAMQENGLIITLL